MINNGKSEEAEEALAEDVGCTRTIATGVVSNARMHNMKEDTKDMAKDSWHEEKRFRTWTSEGYGCENGQRFLQVVSRFDGAGRSGPRRVFFLGDSRFGTVSQRTSYNHRPFGNSNFLQLYTSY